MKHSFIDQYSELDSFIHRLDPRTKLITTLVFIVFAVLTPVRSWQAFIVYFCLIATCLLISRLPPLFVLRRSLVIFPFVLVVGIFIPFFKPGEVAGSYNIWLWQVSVTYDGLFVLANLTIKAWLCILSLILLSGTTKFTDLLKGLEQLRIPRVIILILSFMYRYTFLLADEAMRMQQARETRNFGSSRFRQLKTLGSLIGTLFIRSYERAERVYAAMLARGFAGEVHTLRQLNFKKVDLYFGLPFAITLICSYCLLAAVT